MGTCKYLELMCEGFCEVNDNGTHVVQGKGKLAFYKLDKEGVPMYLGRPCSRYGLFLYIESLMKPIAKKPYDLIVFCPDSFSNLFNGASVFGPVENLEVLYESIEKNQ